MSDAAVTTAEPAMPADVDARPSKIASITESRWFVLLVSLVFVMPMALAPVLPMVDIGGHIGRYAIQLDAGRTPELAQWYSFTWSLLPNLGADLIVQLLGQVMDVELATRISVLIAVAVQASGLLVLSRRLHNAIQPWALIALPLIYSFSFNFGFLNFVLSVGLAFWAMVAWLHFEDAKPAKRWAIFALIASGVWLCHLVGWAVFCVLAGSRELVRNWEKSGLSPRTVIATSIAVSCLLVPLAIGAAFSPSDGEAGPTDGWFIFGWKVLSLMNVMLDRWEMWDRLGFVVVLMALIWGFLIKETRCDRGMALAAAIFATFAALMPTQVLGSHYADIRLFPVVLMVGLLSLRASAKMPAAMVSALLLVGLCFAGIRLAGTTVSAQLNGRELARELTVLESLPEHSQMVMLRAERCIEGLDASIDLTPHLGGYAIARRSAFSNDQWQLVGAQLMRIHNPALAPYDQDPSQYTFTGPCGEDPGIEARAAEVPQAASHLWVVWDGEPKPLTGWSQIATGDKSVLYARYD